MNMIDDSDKALIALACNNAVAAIHNRLDNARFSGRTVESSELLAAALFQLQSVVWSSHDLNDCIACLNQNQKPQEAA